jgi:hypothetical protein
MCVFPLYFLLLWSAFHLNEPLSFDGSFAATSVLPDWDPDTQSAALQSAGSGRSGENSAGGYASPPDRYGCMGSDDYCPAAASEGNS